MKMKHAFAGMLGQWPPSRVWPFAQAEPRRDKTTTATLGGKVGKRITKYSAPSVKGRKIFGGEGALQPDNSVWRAGANNATALHTDGDITIGTVNVPAGDYTLYVQLDPKGLAVDRQQADRAVGHQSRRQHVARYQQGSGAAHR